MRKSRRIRIGDHVKMRIAPGESCYTVYPSLGIDEDMIYTVKSFRFDGFLKFKEKTKGNGFSANAFYIVGKSEIKLSKHLLL